MGGYAFVLYQILIASAVLGVRLSEVGRSCSLACRVLR